MTDVYTFISYNVAHDSETARFFRERLEENGLKCWMAPRDIHVGKSGFSEIVKAIKDERCDTMISLVSTGYNNSDSCTTEATLAFENHVKLMPVLLEDIVLNDDLQYIFKRAQWKEVRDNIDGVIRQIIDELRLMRGIKADSEDKKDSLREQSEKKTDFSKDMVHSPKIEGFVNSFESGWMKDHIADGTLKDLGMISTHNSESLLEAGIDPKVYIRIIAEKIARSHDDIEKTMELIEMMPDYCWKVLLAEDGRLVGYWYMMALSADKFKEVMTGMVDEKTISLADGEYLDLPGHYKGYLLLSGTIAKYRVPPVVQMLYGSLAEHFQKLAEYGIFFDELGTMVASPMGISGMRNLGLKEVNDYWYGGKMFWLDMTQIEKNRFFGRFPELVRLYKEEFENE